MLGKVNKCDERIAVVDYLRYVVRRTVSPVQVFHPSGLPWKDIYLDDKSKTDSLKTQRILLFVIYIIPWGQRIVRLTALVLVENPHDESSKSSYKRIGIVTSHIHKLDLELCEEGKSAGTSAYSLTRRRVRMV